MILYYLNSFFFPEKWHLLFLLFLCLKIFKLNFKAQKKLKNISQASNKTIWQHNSIFTYIDRSIYISFLYVNIEKKTGRIYSRILTGAIVLSLSDEISDDFWFVFPFPFFVFVSFLNFTQWTMNCYLLDKKKIFQLDFDIPVVLISTISLIPL